MQFIDEVAAHRLAELPGGFFGAVCTGTRQGGHVHRDVALHN